MSYVDRHRWLRRGLSLVIVLGLIALVSVDVAVAQQRRAHDRKVAAARAERRAERAYLAALKPIVEGTYAAAGPVNDVLSALNFAETDDVFAARDALAHGQSLADLQSLSKRVHALKVPPGIREQAGKVTESLDSMRDAVADLGSHASDEDFDHLNEVLTGSSATDFLGGQSRFVDATVAAYGKQRVTPPFTSLSDGPQPGPTSTAWIFGADTACLTADIALIPTYKLVKSKSLADYRRYLVGWSAALKTLAAKLAKLHRPVGAGALPVPLAARMSIVRTNADVFAAELRAFDRRDEPAYADALVRLRAVLPRLAQLGRAMRAYGAVSCAQIMGAWAGDKSASKPGGGVTQT